ncbi:MAG: polysaccharide biosynthesis C-terminal domain-containing protein [Ignavibacteria bacterium]
MGIVRRQALANSFFSYLGVIIGYLNLILLFPTFFSAEQYGLINLMIGLSTIYSYLSAVGLVTSITKYFPFFKSGDRFHNGFVTLVFLIASLGFLAVTVLYLILRPGIIEAYAEKSPMFLDYYFVVIPISFFALVFSIFESFARAIYKTSFATFAKEVGIRVLTTVSIVLYIIHWLDFKDFVLSYIVIYGLNAVMLVIYVFLSREYKFSLNLKYIDRSKLKELLKFGGFVLISSVTMIVTEKVSILIIGSMVGLAVVGAYSMYFYIASVIYVPMRAMSRISVPIIAASFKEKDYKTINDIYQRTSIIQLVIGILIYVGVIINRHNLFYFLKQPAYIENFGIFYFVGLAVLIDIMVGLNSEIITNSEKYKFDSLFNFVLLIVSIISNLLLIPLVGGLGAAIATAISFFTFNYLKWRFIVHNFDMQPLTIKQIYSIAAGLLTLFLGEILPPVKNVFIDIAYRSVSVSIFYFLIIILLKVSADINERVVVYKNYIFQKFNK